MGDSFTHLHLHTEFSMLDGAARVGEVIAAAAADGQPAIGITDHGNMYGVLHFYEEAIKQGIKPVIGSELYMAGESRHERPARRSSRVDDTGGEAEGGKKLYYHLTALAETTNGYRNLIKLSSEAFLTGYFYKPRCDWELLEQFKEGLIISSGCLGGVVLQALLAGQEQLALERAARFQDIFGRDNFFIELQDHGIPEQIRTNPQLIHIAKKLKAPLLATNDSHYTHRQDAEAHDALLCVQTASLLSDPNRFKFHGDEHYLKSAAEMRHLFRDYPEACDNTLWIAERADVQINTDGHPELPNFPLPPEYETEKEYLRHLVYQGAYKRWGAQLEDEYVRRLDYELDVIESMGFSAYFLIVWDLINYANSQGIRTGPGRGSAAGSAVSYCLGIVNIDPIRYDLLFERFLNPGRKSMPDIDMDFDSRYRERMIQYSAEKYGRDKVCQIITFGTIKARNAVRDAARVLGFDYSVGDRIAKSMPPLVMGRDTPLHACLAQHPKYEDGFKAAAELRAMYEADPDARKVIDVAKGLEGLRRSDGIHAAAVVITRNPLTDYLPIQRKPDGKVPLEQAPVVTQFEMGQVEQLGLLKMDFLGLRNLDVMEMALDLIEHSTTVRPDIDNIPLDDEKTFQLLCKGDSMGVFQLEGTEMRALMRALAPTVFDDICALVALYRPGPMAANMHYDYADRKNGRQRIEYLHPDLEEILGPTYGLMIYQELMMRVAQKMAGYSLQEADNLRKAAGKKKRDVMAKERQKFEDGCEATGYGRKVGKQLFDIIEPFADYAFNKSHAFGYGYISYQTAWLKANYPTQYLAALLTSVKDKQEKMTTYLAECAHMGIEVKVPDINVSLSDFGADPETNTIPFGLSAIRNVGEGLVSHIVDEREKNGPFTDFYEFCQRVDPMVLNKRAVESLIKAGGFDSLGHPRKGLLHVHEVIIERTLAKRKEAESGVQSLFDSIFDDDGEASTDDGPSFDDTRVPIPDVEFEKKDRLAFEKEMLGLYISDHPLKGAESALERVSDLSIADFRERRPTESQRVGGLVSNLVRKYTRKGDLMATFTLEDLGGSIDCMVFPKTMSDYGHLLRDDAIVVVRGRCSDREDEVKLMASDVRVPDLVLSGGPPVRVRVHERLLSKSAVDRLKSIIGTYPGQSPVFLHLLRNDTSEQVIRLADDFLVESSSSLSADLKSVFGPECLL